MSKKLLSTIFAAVLFLSIAQAAFASSTGTVERYVRFRSAPSTSSTVYASLKPGTALQVLDKVNAYWLKVQVNGKVGYVSSGYVSYNEPAPAPAPAPQPPASGSFGQDIVNTAESFQGRVTYVYGQRDVTHLIFDCSSFTQYVFKLNGVSIPWGAGKQTSVGSYVSKANLQPGDLVMFTVGTATKIGHVGIYIGNGQFIHNLPRSGVVISNLNSSYWTRHYVTARHITR